MASALSVVAVEGIIGAGKTVLMENLKSSMPWARFIFEDLDDWRSLSTADGPANIFNYFYSNPTRYSYAFQNHVLKSLASRVSDGNFVVMERSLGASLHVFSALMREKGFMDSIEFATLEGWVDFLGRVRPLDSRLTPVSLPSVVLYLDISPETALGRMQMRGRAEEGGVDVGYLKDLVRLHEAWFAKDNSFKVIRLDASKAPMELAADALAQLKKLDGFQFPDA
jgi:deoxyadenosine/deoxycytidine kinase